MSLFEKLNNKRYDLQEAIDDKGNITPEPGDIAKEKSGIIKKNTPIVVGETQDKIKSIFIDFASAKSSEIVFADDFIYDNYECDLQGNYQKKNRF